MSRYFPRESFEVEFRCGHRQMRRIAVGPGTEQVKARERQAAARVSCPRCRRQAARFAEGWRYEY